MIILHSTYSKASRDLVAAIGDDPGNTVIDWDANGKDVNEYLSQYSPPSQFPALVDEESGVMANGASSPSDLASAVFAYETKNTMSRLAAACKLSIVSGVQSDALGEAYFYPTGELDQFNLSASVLKADKYGDTKGAYRFWCMDAQGNWVRLDHTAAQVDVVSLVVDEHVRSERDKYAVKLGEMAAATSIEELRAITW